MRTGTLAKAVCAFVLLAGAAFGAAEERLEKARSLYEQAEPLVRTAEDPDAENKERDDARAQALKLLKQARDEFQAWQAANGENADDEIGPKIGKLFYWVKKMTGIGGGSDRPAPKAPDPPREGAPPAPPAPAEGGGPANPPGPPAPPDPAQKAREDFAQFAELEKSLKSDPAALKEAYERFLSAHPDPSLPEYTKAATRIGQIQEELNATFKAIARKDPEQLDNLDSKANADLVRRLKTDLNTKDPDLRRNAARLLGLTRSGAASYALVQVLRDPDTELGALAGDSLVAIGGWRTAEHLTKQHRDGSNTSQMAALAVLERIAQKGSVDAQSVSYWIGRFVLSNDGAVADRALRFLEGLGADGGPGLVEAMETRMPDKKVAVIDSIAKARYHRGARRISALLLRGDGAAAVMRGRAIECLKQMGIHTIPHLLPALGDGRTKDWTAFTLRAITGENYSGSDIGAWKKWYVMHKNDAGYNK